jgi:phenylacetate-CoA ligase
MRSAEHWAELTRIEPAFLVLERKIQEGSIQDYRQIGTEAFAWHGWDQLPFERLFPLLLPFLRQQLGRARRAMPGLYGTRLAGIDPEAIQTPADWQLIPLLVKDDLPEHGLRGFRTAANQDPFILRPSDLRASAIAFGSGGSSGRHTPTFVTLNDRQREIQAWRRGHSYHGLVQGDSVLYSYNTTHKGGQWMQESLLAHGIHVYLRRPEEGPRQVLENLRACAANALFTVQQPYEAMLSQEKAAGINLHSLVQASLEDPSTLGILLPDAQGRKQIEFIFLGGFEIVPYALELVERYLEGTPVATLLGSSEAIPQACSTNPVLTPGAACHANNLHLLPGPHYVEIVKKEGEAWVPVGKGEQGLLVYTSWARDGTLWIRYAPGDVATLLLAEGECPCGLFTPVISDVHRQDAAQRKDLLLHGCAAG